MNANNREIEVKFKIDKFDKIRKILKQKKAKFLGKAFERTIRFDTLKKDLEKKDCFLRVRTGFENVITFKRKIKNKDFKEREEIELEIADPEKMKIILGKLGFFEIGTMEKYREKWIFKNTEISIDKLPFGNFIEIEGDKSSIKKVAEDLNLDFKERITKVYWRLWKESCGKKRIKSENIVFKEKSKS